MPNDTPFVELPSPPRSPNQPASDADIRGNDFGPTMSNDEYARAVAYRDHIITMSKGHEALLRMLAGKPGPYRSLQHKTLPLTRGAPPHIEGG